MVKAQTSLPKELNLPHSPMAKCQLSGCTVDATTRLTIKNPKKCTTAFIDLCDRHIRETTEKAKPDSYLLCSLEHIRKVRETKLQSA